MFPLGWILLITMVLIGCGAQARNPHSPSSQSPLWTVENPNASTGRSKMAAQKASPDPKREAVTPVTASSLDALQTGQSTATPAASPIQDVNFAFDSHELTEEARQILKGNAEWMKSHPSVTVQIEGHCDERGTVEYNLALGARRAQTVKEYLTTLGVGVDRLSDISYGEEIPVCRESTEACWERNRRARFVVTGGSPVS
jgi:peptidoglycan-associated lipoprotein